MKQFHRLSSVRFRRGFTLVELMIIVALIAMLAALAVPNYLRARKRSQGTRAYEDLRMVDSAVAQYAIEKSKGGAAPVVWTDLVPYIKTDTPLAVSNGQDILGHPFGLSTVDSGAKVPTDTALAFSDVIP